MDKRTPRQKFNERNTSLKNERSSWDPEFRDLAEYVSPRRYRDNASDTNKGGRKNSRIINNTATQSLRTLASGMQAGVTSPARPWFRLSTPDPALSEKQAVKQWLYTNQMRMQQLFNQSNLYNVLPSVYADLGLYSTAALMELEDDQDHIRFYHFPMGSYAIATDHRQQVNSFYREYKQRVSNLVEKFGIDKVSQQVKTLYETQNYDQLIDCIHAIEPRFERDDRKRDNKNMPFKSVYLEAGKGDAEGDVLREGGFDEFAVFVPRWEVVGEDSWGSHGPGMTAIGDIKGLQLEERRKYEAIDKMVNPPMQAPSSLKNGRTSLLPGDVTYADTTHAGGGFRPVYEINPRVNELMLDMQNTEQRIRRAFYEDLFLMLANDTRSNVTAREIAEKHEEKMLMIGPVLERIHAELLDPMIARTFGIMMRRGMVPPPPPELQGMEIKVEYVSVLAQAQQMVGLAPIERLIGFAGQAAQLDPTVLDKVDFDQAIDRYAEMAGGPPDIVRSDEMVGQIREGRARAQAEAKQQEQMAGMAQVAGQAAKAAKDLSDTSAGDTDALSALVGQ